MTNNTPAQNAIEAARDLSAALTLLSSALQGGRLDDMLAAETLLSTAVTRVTQARVGLSATALPPESRLALRLELDEARAALNRCTALGSALEDLARSRSALVSYGRSGETVSLPVIGSVKEAA